MTKPRRRKTGAGAYVEACSRAVETLTELGEAWLILAKAQDPELRIAAWKGVDAADEKAVRLGKRLARLARAQKK